MFVVVVEFLFCVFALVFFCKYLDLYILLLLFFSASHCYHLFLNDIYNNNKKISLPLFDYSFKSHNRKVNKKNAFKKRSDRWQRELKVHLCRSSTLD
jgi:hypothetical protein